MELQDKNFKDILSHSKLELPFSDFDYRMMQRIEEYELKKKVAEKNKLFSHICFLLGILLGTVLNYLMSQNLSWLSFSDLNQQRFSFAMQLVYVFLIVLFADKLWKLSKIDFKKLFK